MRLHLLVPPALVTVEDGGVRLPALHLATRGDRCYVQVSRAAGCNHLRWVSSARVGPAERAPGAAQAVRTWVQIGRAHV